MTAPWANGLVAVALVSAIPMAVMLVLSAQPARVHRLVPRLVPLAAGALLGAAAFHLIPESPTGDASRAAVAAMMGTGLVAFLALDRWLHRGVPPMVVGGSGAAEWGDVAAAQRAHQLLPLTMAGDALHNVVDGMLVAAAYLDNPSLGLLTGAAIALHELPRELGTFAILVRGGTSVRGALLFNALTALGAVGGAVATLAIGTHVTAFAAAMVPFAAGNFLYLAAAIGLAEFRGAHTRRALAGKVLVAIAGLALTAGVFRH